MTKLMKFPKLCELFANAEYPVILARLDRPAQNGIVPDYFCFNVPVCVKFLMKHGDFYIF